MKFGDVFMINLLVLLLSVFLAQEPKSNSAPLVLATDPYYLGSKGLARQIVNPGDCAFGANCKD